MILIDRKETDPFFNIAAEEYVLKEKDEDVFMLWINEPSVIIGKHQVAAAEADMVYIHRNNIPLIRRISGGGTVYHDRGNLNYSLILRGERGKLVDYKKYSGTVIRALAQMGLDAKLEGKSNLVIGDLKFSGNAEHVYRNKVLHHGTILFDTDLRILRHSIRPDHRDYVDKSIRSNDSSITNLRGHLPENIGMRELRDILIRQIMEDYPGIQEYTFNPEDQRNITELSEEKYKSNKWNISYSPRYELHKQIKLGNKTCKLEIKTEKGFIREISFMENDVPIMPGLSKELTNVLHHPEELGRIIHKYSEEEISGPAIKEELINALF
ncbi:MAG TPA: lipoate--protein ligase family protein [Bacteroidales bacterium]|nr:lipoate--protein ligase family protein [Bacteroidales bacterium]